MRSRKPAHDEVAQVARRRLELLSAELAGLRPDPPTAWTDPPGRRGDEVKVGPGELTSEPSEGSAETAGRHARRSTGFGDAVGGWLHDRLPPTLQGRVQLGSSHLTVLAVIVAIAMSVTAWLVLRAGGSGSMVPVVAPSASALVSVAPPDGAPSGPPSAASTAGLTGASSGGLAGAPSSGASGTASAATSGTRSTSGTPAGAGTGATVVVDVTGKVHRPGIATLPAGARVVDAVEAAGGARRGADLTGLNLARVLADGEQIVVGVPAPTGVAASAAANPGSSSAGGGPPALVNINTADQTALETLPGI